MTHGGLFNPNRAKVAGADWQATQKHPHPKWNDATPTVRMTNVWTTNVQTTLFGQHLNDIQEIERLLEDVVSKVPSFIKWSFLACNIILSLMDSISHIAGTTASLRTNYAYWLADWSWGQSSRLRQKCLQSIRTLKWLMSFPAARTTKAIRANRQMFFSSKSFLNKKLTMARCHMEWELCNYCFQDKKLSVGPCHHGVRLTKLLFQGGGGGEGGGGGGGWVVCLAHLCPRHVLQKLRCREGKKFP